MSTQKRSQKSSYKQPTDISSNAGRLGHGGPCAQGRMSHPPTVANSLLASSRLCKCAVRGPLVSPMADARKRYCRTFGGCCSLRGSNPRPLAHKTSALTTELRERLLTFEIERKNIKRLIARHCRGPVAGHATPTSSCHTSGPRNAPIASPPSPTAPDPATPRQTHNRANRCWERNAIARTNPACVGWHPKIKECKRHTRRHVS